MLVANALNFLATSEVFKAHIKKFDLELDAIWQTNVTAFEKAEDVFLKIYLDYGEVGNSKADFTAVVKVLDENKFALV